MDRKRLLGAIILPRSTCSPGRRKGLARASLNAMGFTFYFNAIKRGAHISLVFYRSMEVMQRVLRLTFPCPRWTTTHSESTTEFNIEKLEVSIKNHSIPQQFYMTNFCLGDDCFWLGFIANKVNILSNFNWSRREKKKKKTYYLTKNSLANTKEKNRLLMNQNKFVKKTFSHNDYITFMRILSTKKIPNKKKQIHEYYLYIIAGKKLLMGKFLGVHKILANVGRQAKCTTCYIFDSFA